MCLANYGGKCKLHGLFQFPKGIIYAAGLPCEVAITPLKGSYICTIQSKAGVSPTIAMHASNKPVAAYIYIGVNCIVRLIQYHT